MLRGKLLPWNLSFTTPQRVASLRPRNTSQHVGPTFVVSFGSCARAVVFDARRSAVPCVVLRYGSFTHTLGWDGIEWASLVTYCVNASTEIH